MVQIQKNRSLWDYSCTEAVERAARTLQSINDIESGDSFAIRGLMFSNDLDGKGR